jgi:hypothetical protein
MTVCVFWLQIHSPLLFQETGQEDAEGPEEDSEINNNVAVLERKLEVSDSLCTEGCVLCHCWCLVVDDSIVETTRLIFELWLWLCLDNVIVPLSSKFSQCLAGLPHYR